MEVLNKYLLLLVLLLLLVGFSLYVTSSRTACLTLGNPSKLTLIKLSTSKNQSPCIVITYSFVCFLLYPLPVRLCIHTHRLPTKVACDPSIPRTSSNFLVGWKNMDETWFQCNIGLHNSIFQWNIVTCSANSLLPGWALKSLSPHEGWICECL